MLLFSSCQVAGFSSQFSPLQAHLQINAGGVLCRAGGSLTCLCLVAPTSPSGSLPGRSSSPCTQPSWPQLAGVREPSSQKFIARSPCWSQRQDRGSPVASLTASSSYSRVPCSLLLEAWEGRCSRSPESGPLCQIMVSVCRTDVGDSAAAGVTEEGE